MGKKGKRGKNRGSADRAARARQRSRRRAARQQDRRARDGDPEALRSRPDPADRPVWRAEPISFGIWGAGLDPQALAQMHNAARLPVAVAGALLPDAHKGYGLPIGGVLATDNSVIPYAVGMDIACRMKLSVLDWPVESLLQRREALIEAVENETAFGTGAAFGTARRRNHRVLDEDWSVSPVTRREKDNAWKQLGSSGSGNHFVEFGEMILAESGLGLEPGRYLALLSHSGSRNPGLQVATHYSRLARDLNPRLPRELQHLAWLDLSRQSGQEYWQAMELMGRYAAASHELIHRHVLARLGAAAVAGVENHHNFAWIEEHGGRRLIVHRKGATPAGAGDLGVIPGTMAHPGFVVRGRGNPASLESAAHGAGRRMSRTEATRRFRWSDVERLLDERGVELLSAGLDEIPLAYKNIDEVMAAQEDLVEIVARFQPRLVKMAPGKRGYRRSADRSR